MGRGVSKGRERAGSKWGKRESCLGQYYFDENIERFLTQSTYPSYRAYLELTTIITLERGHLIEVTWPGRLIG